MTVTRHTTIAEIKAANEKAGYHYFSPATMKFFESRVGQTTWTCPDGTVLFTTSEKGPSGVRLYTVRRYHPATGDITDASKFQEFAYARHARAYAANLAVHPYNPTKTY